MEAVITSFNQISAVLLYVLPFGLTQKIALQHIPAAAENRKDVSVWYSAVRCERKCITFENVLVFPPDKSETTILCSRKLVVIGSGTLLSPTQGIQGPLSIAIEKKKKKSTARRPPCGGCMAKKHRFSL